MSGRIEVLIELFPFRKTNKKNEKLKISLKLERRAIHTANTAFLYFTIFLLRSWMTFVCQWLVRITATLQQCSSADHHLALFWVQVCVVHRLQMTKQFHSYSFSWIHEHAASIQLVVVRKCLKNDLACEFQSFGMPSYSIKCTRNEKKTKWKKK